MKHLFLILALTATIGTVYSQTQSFPKIIPASERAEDQTEKLKKPLRLNELQLTRVYDINFKTNEKFDILRQDVQANNSDHQKSLNALGNERDGLMEDVLDDKQFLLYMKMR